MDLSSKISALINPFRPIANLAFEHVTYDDIQAVAGNALHVFNNKLAHFVAFGASHPNLIRGLTVMCLAQTAQSQELADITQNSEALKVVMCMMECIVFQCQRKCPLEFVLETHGFYIRNTNACNSYIPLCQNECVSESIRMEVKSIPNPSLSNSTF